mmetsp:Transcript_61312/g.161125  ORF Transcript_61312/g.161125 Transcript_61312/m.161125 type:complete len:217 (-) Transcript_61312:17-667(-)
MLIWLTGYFDLPSAFVIFTDLTASTMIFAKTSPSHPTNLEEREVFAICVSTSWSSSFTLTLRLLWMYFRDSFIAMRYPEMTVVGWMLFLTSSFARFSSSAAMITTEVVPSPTSVSCRFASSTRTLAAGCSTSSCCRMVAPSLVIVMSPMSSTSILSRPCGPSDDFRILARAMTAVTFCDRISPPLVRSPWRDRPSSVARAIIGQRRTDGARGRGRS